MPELLFFTAYCIKLYMWVFILDVILSWLASLNALRLRTLKKQRGQVPPRER